MGFYGEIEEKLQAVGSILAYNDTNIKQANALELAKNTFSKYEKIAKEELERFKKFGK